VKARKNLLATLGVARERNGIRRATFYVVKISRVERGEDYDYDYDYDYE